MSCQSRCERRQATDRSNDLALTRQTMARILVVDDQEMMRDSLAATLAREGHEVVAAGDGAGGVSRLSRRRGGSTCSSPT